MKQWLHRVFVKFTEYQQKRADYMILKMLSDKELRDIGITRGEIRSVVHGIDKTS